MVLEKLRERSRLLLVLCFKLLEHGGHCARVVTGGPHVLNSQLVRLFLGAATELQKSHAFKKSGAIVENVADDWTAEQDTCQHSIVHQLHLAFILHRVTSSHVCNLMRHNAGELCLVVGGEN